MPDTPPIAPEDYDPTAPETFDSPHAVFADLRARCPVAHSQAFDGFWAVTRYQDIHDILMQPETYITSVRNVVPSAQVQDKLRLARRARVTELQRVRFLNREPISLDVTYVPSAIGARLTKEDLATRDIFVILENDYGLSLGHADLQIGSTLADEALAAHLKVEEGSPVLFIERTTHTAAGEPIDYEHLYYRGDAFQYKVRVDRVPVPHI